MPDVFIAEEEVAPPVRYRWLGFAIHGMLILCILLIVCGLGVFAEFLRRAGMQLAYSSSGLVPKFEFELLYAALICIGSGLLGLVWRDILKAIRDIAFNSWVIANRTTE